MAVSPSGPAAPASADTADRLHSAAIHLLRWLRREDDRSGLGGPQLSALSVVVAAGPLTLGALAAAEQVRAPTITRLVQALEGEGLVTRAPDPHDGRATRVIATAKGRRVLAAGRARRVAALERRIADLASDERLLLARAAELMEQLVAHPA
ncbi:hypothetical protein tb265_42980 [Gemmatimonadetes bacterium T265]|nr:hypothetical protein tb265_42980 [Gemmatimonadetes bacterium T265]